MIRAALPLVGLLLLAGALALMGLGAQTLVESSPAPPAVIMAPPEVVEVVRIVRVPAPPEPLPPRESTPTAQVAVAAIEVLRYYDAEAILVLLGRTPWPVHLWQDVLALISCESPAPTGADSQAVGDKHLTPLTGPSLGLTQINISEWPQYARSYDLLDPRANLLAAWGIYAESGYSFAPWSCAP